MNIISRDGLVVSLVIFASAISLIAHLPPAVMITCAFVQVFLLPGYTFLLFLGDRGRSLLDSFFLSLLLSPIVLTLLVLAAHAITGSLAPAAHASLMFLYALLIVSLFARRGQQDGRPHGPTGLVLIASGIFCGLVVCTHCANDYLFAWDIIRHTAIANEILYRGIPPLEPFFPDIPIQSNWAVYLFPAVWKMLSGLTMVQAMWIFNCVSAFVFPYLIARIASWFAGGRIDQIAAPFFAIAGLSAASWILWPARIARAFFGEVRGMAEIQRFVQDAPLDGTRVVNFLTPPPALAVSTLEKYLTIDVQHYALNLFLFCLIIALRPRLRRNEIARGGIQLLVAAIGAFLFHVFTGIFMAIGIALTGAVAFVRERWSAGRTLALFDSIVVPACGVLAGAVGLWHFKSYRGVYADGVFVPDRVTLNWMSVVTIVIPLVVLLPFSLSAIRAVFGDAHARSRTLARWIIAFLIVAVIFDIRGPLESNAILLLFFLLIVPVSLEIVERLRRSRGTRRISLSAWIAVLFLVPSVLTVRGFILDKPRDAHHLRRYRITADERALYSWIRDHTSIEAVVAERNEYNVMPFYAERRNFYMTSWEITNYGYRGEKVEQYRAARDELFSNARLSTDTIRLLESFPFDIYVVLWGEDVSSGSTPADRFDRYPEWFEPVYRNQAGRVYRLVKDCMQS